MLKHQEASGLSQKNSALIEEMYAKYHKLMFYVAAKLLPDPRDVEDAVFATWEEALKNIQKFYNATELQRKSLLMVMLKTTIIDMIRRQTLESKTLQMQESKGTIAEDAEIQNLEVIEWLSSIKEYAEILILYYIHGYKMAEIGNLLNTTESNISRKLKKGVTLLREQMGENL